ncbi:hypothetical protein TNCV_3009931 [Trichonephila clavipes]|nr:hypothetical protein TNCV_3009931 [Trichonephila clavipes]
MPSAPGRLKTALAQASKFLTVHANSLLSRVHWRFSFQKASKIPAALSSSQTQNRRCKPSRRANAKSATKSSKPSTKSSQKRYAACYNEYQPTEISSALRKLMNLPNNPELAPNHLAY